MKCGNFLYVSDIRTGLFKNYLCSSNRTQRRLNVSINDHLHNEEEESGPIMNNEMSTGEGYLSYTMRDERKERKKRGGGGGERRGGTTDQQEEVNGDLAASLCTIIHFPSIIKKKKSSQCCSAAS